MSFTPLMMAACNGDLKGMRESLGEAGKQDEWGWTALMLAAFNGKLECARLLLSEAGMQTTKEWKITSDDTTVCFPPGTTALMIAAHCNYPEVVELLLPYEQGLTDSEGHTARWHANSSSWGGSFTRVRRLLQNEGSERTPSPQNPAEMLKLSAENDSLKKDLASSKKAREEAEERLAQSNQEVASLKQQLSKTTEALSHSHTDSEALKRELADQRTKILALEKELSQLKSESQNAKNLQAERDDLQRRLEEAEEKNRDLLRNLVEAGSRLVNGSNDQDS